MKRRRTRNRASLPWLRELDKRLAELARDVADIAATPAWNGNRLRWARKSVGYSQAELARRINECSGYEPRISQSHVSRWERGTAPNADSIARIAVALGSGEFLIP